MLPGGTVYAFNKGIMPTMFKPVAANPMLFNEIVRTVETSIALRN